MANLTKGLLLKAVVLLLLSLFLFANAVAASSINLTDPGFETGNLSGWSALSPQASIPLLSPATAGGKQAIQ